MSKLDKTFNVLAMFIVAIPLLVFGINMFRGGLFIEPDNNHEAELIAAAAIEPVSTTEISPFSTGYISITFDDGWRSSYTNGASLLGDFNMPATFYILSDYFDAPGYMAVEQVTHLNELGHQIASHTATHADLTVVDEATLDYEVNGAKRQLENLFGPVEDFASPYNKFNDGVLEYIRRSYRSHRNTNSIINTADTFNVYDINSHTLTKSITPDKFQLWLRQTSQQKGWLVLNYHQIDESDSDYATSPADFKTHLELIQRSGLQVVRLDQFLNSLTES